MSNETSAYDEAAREAVDIGNRIAEGDSDADSWDIADGLLAGAIHFWLYTRQPCDDVTCEDCAPINTAEQRVSELVKLVRQMAQESDYYHSPNDANVGRA